jgi:hypothetical protein
MNWNGNSDHWEFRIEIRLELPMVVLMNFSSRLSGSVIAAEAKKRRHGQSVRLSTKGFDGNRIADDGLVKE